MFLNKLRSKQSESGWKLRNNYGGGSNDRMWETGCEKIRWGEGVGGCHWSDCRTCCRSLRREDNCCVSNTFVTSGCIFYLHLFTGNRVPNVRYHPQTTGKCSSLRSIVTPQAVLCLSLFCGNSLARPLIVIHPSSAPVYKREIRISITGTQRQHDWWVSHRIPPFPTQVCVSRVRSEHYLAPWSDLVCTFPSRRAFWVDDTQSLQEGSQQKVYGNLISQGFLVC